MADWGFIDGVQRCDAYGENTATSAGTAITSPGASLNSKAGYTEIVASTSFDAVGLIVSGSMTSSAVTSLLFDIAIGAAGSEQVIVPNMHAFRGSSANTVVQSTFIPVSIPAGTRIAARYQHSANGSALQLSVVVLGATANYPILGGQVVTYGADTTASKGALVDPGGVAHTKGSYTEITAATTLKSNWLAVSAMPDSASTNATWLLDIAVGAAGSEQVIIPDLQIYGMPTVGTQAARVFIPVALPSGVRLAARVQSNATGAGGRNLGVLVHAIG